MRGPILCPKDWGRDMTVEGTTAVIGAGLAGLTCARALVDAGQTVTVFDKGRGLGGRMASRRADGWRFDHGAVVLRPQTAAFSKFLKDVETADHAARWNVGDGYTGLSGMSGIVKPMAKGLDILSTQRVLELSKHGSGWQLHGPEGAQGRIFDCVILAVPQPQAVDLLAPLPAMTQQIAPVSMDPCWTVMLGFEERVDTDLAHSDTLQGAICVLSRETVKPGRDVPGDAWVIQAGADWTRAHLDSAPSEVTSLLTAEFFKALECAPQTPAISMAHRWLYARTATPFGQSHIWSVKDNVGICGDWCIGATAEAAFESGTKLAQAILRP